MATQPARRKPSAATQVELEVFLGAAEHAVGRLVYVLNGPREFSQFAYLDAWLKAPRCFDISPDLARTAGHQVRKAPTRDDSTFFFALADTEPDSWGRRVIARAHAKERKGNPALGALNELDYLCAVDDLSRIGALRLRDAGGRYLRTTPPGSRATPPLLELQKMLAASRAVEMSTETAEDLSYLIGKGTSLGGMRPKCSVLDDDGALALGKFPSVQDERSVTRGEVLALRLAGLAGIEVAQARVAMVHDVPVALVRRFDRMADGARIPYMSGTALLQAGRNEDHAYTEVVDAMRATCWAFKTDAQQLWRRMVFNHLITNVDDHLHNVGFLYVGGNQWRLAPAFDLNPFPDKARESKTWLTEDSGPVVSVHELLAQAARFELRADEARQVLAQVVAAVSRWRDVARWPDIGLPEAELDRFAPAFEHQELDEARALAR
ncbi:HipA domain-containing protein [Roseateles sp.]|uniref:type II toxin-antitoxin system HipA family toxin n=1 Tax=Roseateles sp. TaxID=1971397 RepID=UPI00326393C9